MDEMGMAEMVMDEMGMAEMVMDEMGMAEMGLGEMFYFVHAVYDPKRRKSCA